MLRNLFSGLRARLLLLTLLAVLPALVLTYCTAAEQRRLAAGQAQEEALRLVRLAASEQEQLFTGTHQLLAVLAQLPEVRSGNYAACSTLFAGLLQENPSCTNLGVLGPDGNLLASAVPAAGPVNLADRPYFQRVLATRDFVIGEYQVSRVTGKYSFNLAYPVLNASGQVQAVLAAALDLAWLNRLAAKADLPPGSTLAVVDRNGTVLVRHPDPEQWTGQQVPETHIIRSALGQQAEGTAEGTGIDGVPRLYAFRLLYSSAGGEALYIYAGIPTETALGWVNRLYARNLAWLGLAAALALTVAWTGSNLFFLRRVNTLLDATRRLAAGDLGARTSQACGQGELDQLARAFDEMAATIEQRTAKLRESEETYRTIFENTGTASMIVEEDTTISLANSELESLTGYAKEEIEGKKSWAEFVCAEDLGRMQEYHRLRRTDPGAAPRNYEFRLTDRQGNVKDIFMTVAMIPGTTRSVASMLDITGRKQAEEHVRSLYSENLRRLRTISALYESARKLGESLDLQELAGYITSTCVETFGASLAWLGHAEEDGSVRLLAHFPPENEYPHQITVRWDGPPLGHGPAGQAIRSGRPVVISGIASDPDFAPWREAASGQGFCCAAAFPLISRGRTFGALNLYSSQPGYFTPERAEFFQAYAHQAAAALENARLFKKAQRRYEHLQALRNIDMAITGSLDLRVTFNVILDQVITHLGIDAAGIMLLNPYTQLLEYAAGRGFRTRGMERTVRRMGEGNPGHAAMQRQIVHIPNLPESGNAFARAPMLAGENFITYYGVPLIAKGQVKGVLEIFHRAPLDPSREWLEFLETLAGQAAIAIDNAALFNDLQRSNIELSLAYDATIEGWAHALDLRDKETEGHSRRVTEVTVRLARAMGLSDTELVHVRRGALLHDIGKLGVPDQILLKPGPLTDEEWAIMRRHPVYALEMLSSIEYLRPALDIPYCHHEKWDGTGYPRGLKGKQIPLAARIFALVDVWDALRSDRPYRPAWPEVRVREYILEQAGKHFDPEVVEIFLGMEYE